MDEEKYFCNVGKKADPRGRIIYLLSNSKKWQEKSRPDFVGQSVRTFTCGHAQVECFPDFLEFYVEDEQNMFSVKVPYNQLYEMGDYIVYMAEGNRCMIFSFRIGEAE